MSSPKSYSVIANEAKIPTVFICHSERSEESPNTRATLTVSGNFYQELAVIVQARRQKLKAFFK
jgi:hypothetical protein